MGAFRRRLAEVFEPSRVLLGGSPFDVFNGTKPESYYWYLKEREWHFNGGNRKNHLKDWVKFTSQQPSTMPTPRF
jgi:hypothetical protein